MPLEDIESPGKYINSLVSSNPVGNTDFLDEADNHLRGIKNVLKLSFPNINAPVTATPTQINSWEARIAAREDATLQPEALFPVGVVHITTVNVNPGTYLPGVWVQIAQGRTLIGEGAGAGLTARVAGATGGQEDAIIPSHTHTINDPGHTHQIRSSAASASDGNKAERSNASDVFYAGQSATTGITVNSTGEAVTDKNMQPYLVVYIWERTS